MLKGEFLDVHQAAVDTNVPTQQCPDHSVDLISVDEYSLTPGCFGVLRRRTTYPEGTDLCHQRDHSRGETWNQGISLGEQGRDACHEKCA